MQKKVFILLFLYFLSINLYGQVKVVNFINANRVYAKEEFGPNVRIFAGEVAFEHDSSYFYCDSAIFNVNTKNIKAYGNIVIQKITIDDTIYLFADTLFYDGNKKIAQLRNNVQLIDDTNTLFTNFLDYDLNAQVAKYFNYGKIKSKNDSLISEIGYFYTKTKDVFFKNDVKVYSKKSALITDTLKYNLQSDISYIIGDSKIVYDTTQIFCYKGFYDNKNEFGYLSGRVKIISNEHIIEADSIFYDRKRRFIEAFGNISIVDTIQTLNLKGNYGYYSERKQYSLMTKKPIFIDFYDDSDTLWLRADTIISFIDTLFETTGPIPYRLIFAYHNVIAYKSDLQFKCDSLVFSQLDSVFMLFNKPIIWSQNQQYYGDYIELYMSKNEPKEFFIVDNTYVAEKIDSLRFNIIKSEAMHAFFENKKVSKAIKTGGIEIVYYLKEEADSSLIGVGKMSCDSLLINFDDGKILSIVAYTKPKGKIYPLDRVSKDELVVKGFIWQEDKRPKNKFDVLN